MQSSVVGECTKSCSYEAKPDNVWSGKQMSKGQWRKGLGHQVLGQEENLPLQIEDLTDQDRANPLKDDLAAD